MVALAQSYRKNLKWPVRASSYFVATAASSPAGSDSNPGTLAAPFLTLAHAQTVMRTGNKICYVRAGTYATAGISMNASSDTGLIFSNYPGEVAILDGSTTNPMAFDIGGTVTAPTSTQATPTDIWINGFTIQNYVHNGIFVGTNFGGAGRYKLSNNTIHNIAPASSGGTDGAITLYQGGSGVEILWNKVDNIGAFGFQIDGAVQNTWVVGNVLSNTVQNSSDAGAIYYWDDYGTPHGLIDMALDNTVLNPGASGKLAFGLYCDDLASNQMWFGNWFSGNCQNTVEIHGGNYNLITNNVFDMTLAVFNLFYSFSGAQGSYLMSGNVLSTNIWYSAAASQPQSGYQGSNSFGDVRFDVSTNGLLPPTDAGNLHYWTGGTLVNTCWETFNTSGAAVNLTNFDGADVTNGDPLFRNRAGADYTLLNGSPALTMANSSPACPFLPIRPGVGPLLAGLPPVWAASPNNILRNPDPTVGSVIATSTGGGLVVPAGGTMPTNWSLPAVAGLTTAVMYRGTLQDGTPAIRIRFFGTTTNTFINIMFDNAMTTVIGRLYTHYMGFRICGGRLANVGIFQVYVQDTTNFVNIAQNTFVPSGILSTIVSPTTAALQTGAQTFVSITLTNSAAVDFTVEIAAPQLVW